MTKEQFLDKWRFGSNPLFEADLEAVIATEIAKAQEVKLEDAQPQPELNPIAEVIERGEDVWIKVFSNWSKGTYIGYDTTKNVHLVREDKEGGGNLLSSDKISKIKPITEQPAPNVLNEQFSEVHHKIVDGLGTILSSFGANSGIMSIVMSWGDTQDSVSTLEMLNGYIEKYIDNQPVEPKQPSSQVILDKPFDKERFEAMFRAVVASGEWNGDEVGGTEYMLTQLDAYYTEKKGGNNE